MHYVYMKDIITEFGFEYIKNTIKLIVNVSKKATKQRLFVHKGEYVKATINDKSKENSRTYLTHLLPLLFYQA